MYQPPPSITKNTLITEIAGVRILRTIKDSTEAEVENIIKSEFKFEKIPTKLKEYSEVVKSLIRRLVGGIDAPANQRLEGEERLLLAQNLDYIWRCVLYCQESVLENFNSEYNKDLTKMEQSYQEKYDKLQQEMEEKVKQIDELKHLLMEQEREFEGKMKNVNLEKDRIQKVSEERYFDLERVKYNRDNQSLTGKS